MKFHPYLIFDGDCRAAMELYHSVLGGEMVAMQTHGDSPIADEVPKEHHDLILHACLDVGDGFLLMASDAGSGPYVKPQGLHISIQVDTPEDAERVFAGLGEGGTEIMPMGETFWATRFGMLVDRFGTPWMVNCDAPAG